MTGLRRPFRFGVALSDGFDTASELLQLARQAEDLGYSSLLVGDHFVQHNPPSILGLAWAAGHTEKLRFGTLVLGNDYRHPAVLAKDAAMFDVVSDGRLELGLGAGWLRGDYDAIGLTYDAPGVRIDRLAEALTVVKSCWSGDPFDFSGEHYAIRDYAARPLPVQEPRPPIIVGGGSPRVLRLAGAEADIVGIHPNTARADFVTDTQEERTRRKLEWIREGAGARFDELELMTACEGAVTNQRDAAALRIAALVLVGTVEEICETLQRRREEWGVSYIVLDARVFEAFAPVVARLAGT
jgi:probable F420-dependent oxidoreductase